MQLLYIFIVPEDPKENGQLSHELNHYHETRHVSESIPFQYYLFQKTMRQMDKKHT